jgi:hypothetical protein
MAKYLKQHEDIEVSHVFVADLWRDHRLTPHRQDTFKLSLDPHFAEKVADIVGCTWIHLRLRWFCASTKNPEFRH